MEVDKDVQKTVVAGSFDLLTVIVILAGVAAAAVPIVTALMAPFA